MPIERAWSDIQAHLEASAIRLFPASLDFDPASTPSAVWSDGWVSFLELATELRVTMIYGALYTLDDHEVARMRERLLGEDGEPADEYFQASAHLNEAIALDLAFVHGGVVHLFALEADWYQALREREHVDMEVRAASRRFDRSEQRQQLEAIDACADAWAGELSENREFWTARNEMDRRAAAKALIPDLARALESSAQGPNPAYSRALRVLDAATALVRDEVLPRKQYEARARVSELAAEYSLDPDLLAATTKADRSRVIRRRVEVELGLRDAELVRLIETSSRERTGA